MDHQCPTCSGYLSLVERFESHSDDGSLFGCRECNRLYRYNSRPTAGSSCYTLQRQTLTDREKEVADRPQAEIREESQRLADRRRKLDEERTNLENRHKRKILQIQSEELLLQQKCQHPGFKHPMRQCPDCCKRFTFRSGSAVAT